MKAGPSNRPPASSVAETARYRVDDPISRSGERPKSAVPEAPRPSAREASKSNANELSRVFDDLFASPKTPQEIFDAMAETGVCARMKVDEIMQTYSKWRSAHVEDARMRIVMDLVVGLQNQVDHPSDWRKQHLLFMKMREEEDALRERLRNLITLDLPTEEHVKTGSTYFQSPSFDQDITELLDKPVVQTHGELFGDMLEELAQAAQEEGQDMKLQAIRHIQKRLVEQKRAESLPKSPSKPLRPISRSNYTPDVG